MSENLYALVMKED